jgi:hypothetical protein
MVPRLTIEWKERHQSQRAEIPITPYTARSAVTLIARVIPLTHTAWYLDGNAIDPVHLKTVLTCYADSHGLDKRAYCWVQRILYEDRQRTLSLPVNLTLSNRGVTGTVEHPPPPRYWFWPCRQATSTSGEISLLHPATIRNQVEAALVAAHVHWCPHLQNLDEWELLQWGGP